jgi:hypothetical protein
MGWLSAASSVQQAHCPAPQPPLAGDPSAGTLQQASQTTALPTRAPRAGPPRCGWGGEFASRLVHARRAGAPSPLIPDRTSVLLEAAVAFIGCENRQRWPCAWCGSPEPAYVVRYYDQGWIVASICERCAQRDGIDPLWVA